MLFLVFEIDNERYCLEVSRIIEITPIVIFRELPHAPAYISGVFNYRGVVVPVVDLSMLIAGRPSRPLFSTRIVLVDYVGGDNIHHTIGLLTEKATETISRREEDFQPSGVVVEGAEYLGDVIFDESGMIQRVRIEKLPPDTIRDYQRGCRFIALKENNDLL
ncbi:MAG TPA: chemotaxis protein CheW [Syntrophorhabdaceae bacterium]|nr:chemotaxis protein CheW [Syntrophorhabdaceae bacterium]HPH42279.1 chemotaxis protein CheW [Syntrophorhabdaceae bacterium]